VLLTTYTRALVTHLEDMLAALNLESEARQRITVITVHALARQVAAELGLPPREPEDNPVVLKARFAQAIHALGLHLTPAIPAGRVARRDRSPGVAYLGSVP
jgi:hypothetical protein